MELRWEKWKERAQCAQRQEALKQEAHRCAPGTTGSSVFLEHKFGGVEVVEG